MISGEKEIKIALCSAGELYGGVEQFVYTFATYLHQRKNVSVVVLLFSRGVLYEKLVASQIETHLCLNHKYNIMAIKQIGHLLKEKKVNVVHTHGYKANIFCSIAARICKIPIVKTEHGKMEPSGTGSGIQMKMRLNLLLDRMITKMLLSHVIYVSRDISAHFKKYYGTHANTVIYNGIPKIEISDISLHDIDSSAFNVGIVGRLSTIKGHMYVLQALQSLSQLQNMRLLIFGEGTLEKKLREYCEKNGLASRVSFMGFKKNIHSYLSHLKVLVIPSLYEGLPYILLEAMSLRVPVIASSVGGLKEVIRDRHSGLLVPHGNAEALARALEQMYHDANLRQSLAHRAFQEFINNYTIEPMAEKYLTVYQHAISS